MSFLENLPYPVSHFLGYRKPNHSAKKLPVWRIYFWCFIASWLSIALIEITCAYGPSFQSHHTPMIVASFGATAVLAYGVVESPLAQPRNIILGHTIGAVVGVVISQLFLGIQNNWASDAQYTAVQWVGGATAMALSLTIMQVTKCVHPPGGATALIPVVTTAILDIKWFYIGVVVSSAFIQVAIACLMNNIERKYPMYWWAPTELPLKANPTELAAVLSIPRSAHGPEEDVVDNKVAQKDHSSSSSSSTTYENQNTRVDQALSTLHQHAHHSDTKFILFTSNFLIHSPGIVLTQEEKSTLESLIQKLSP